MQNRFHPLFWFIVVGQGVIAAVFILPTLMFYSALPNRGLLAALVAVCVAGLLGRFATGENGRWFGNNFVKIGAAFWGMGWAIMTLFEPRVGWFIFIGGWGVLTLGLFLVGTADFRKRRPLGYPVVPLLIGLWPIILEASNPSFVTHFEPLVQFQIMFLFVTGWVLQGVTLTHNKLPELLKSKLPSFSSTNA